MGAIANGAINHMQGTHLVRLFKCVKSSTVTYNGPFHYPVEILLPEPVQGRK